jgi:hypothetical protein
MPTDRQKGVNMSHKLRNTAYAEELAEPAVIVFPGGSEGRIEYLKFKQGDVSGEDGYRFSWWRDARLLPRPLDVTEEECLRLFETAVQRGVFAESFLKGLRAILKQ